ncbi:DNA starvation/stationary phase protection protein Dps [Gaopeijia maritima]|uniref:DNA starvation/stationary phase protection protein Dps n=1 Tax=Gaopeijia maritima TaxID=3119007 RepID=UPI003281879A
MSTTISTPHLQTRHTLPDGTRHASVELLNARLADAIMVGLQAKQAHWNVRGPRFLPLHELFDSVAEHAREWADLMAERAGALGGVVDGTPASVIERSDLPTYPTELIDADGHIERMAEVLASFSRRLLGSIEAAGEAGDPATEDVFTEVARAVDQDFWFIEAHTQG